MSTTATTIRSPISDGAVSAAAESAIQPHAWLAAWTLCRREWVRFIRQGNRVFAALGQPIIFWVLLAGLLDPSFHATGAAGEAASAASVSYGAISFPASWC